MSNFQDDRLSTDTRMEDTAREPREMQGREIADDREMSDAERLAMFQNAHFQSVLPKLPGMPGWHVCWLSTTSGNDSVQSRLRLGYELVRPEDVPGWEHTQIKSGTYEGCIGINEMVAAKLPMRLYELYMRQAHHDAPLEEEGKIDDATETIKQLAKDKSTHVQAFDGSQEIQNRGSRKVSFEG